LKPHGQFSASPEKRGGENGYLNPHEIYQFTNSQIYKSLQKTYSEKSHVLLGTIKLKVINEKALSIAIRLRN